MSFRPLPAQVRALLGTTVGSHEQLAILLHLHRDPTLKLTARELGSRLRITESLVETALAELCTAGLLERDGSGTPTRYAYRASEELGMAVAALDREYDANPVEVIRFMTTSAIERLRTSALKAFADAFILTRKRDDG
ncbi:MAG TPA: helix-turn-helix domain-containing protein [Steroidobacteraceae bacterium]|nr:helix-turn-helix domain-containing protein [Steroidobacteraceae bacterium]